jgi:hypothetical protein
MEAAFDLLEICFRAIEHQQAGNKEIGWHTRFAEP